MKRSEINQLIRDATACFEAHGWTLPPNPRWDVTDFGMGDWRKAGLVLINLTEQPEYCEKLMYARSGMVTPMHHHRKKKEDIIARWGELTIWLGPARSTGIPAHTNAIQVNGQHFEFQPGDTVRLRPGERVTLMPGVEHSFEPATEECIIGEVSTANDDLADNFFDDPKIGRFPEIDEDEPAIVKLISE